MGGSRRFCRECGREVRPGARFCPNCGFTVAPSDDDTIDRPLGKGGVAPPGQGMPEPGPLPSPGHQRWGLPGALRASPPLIISLAILAVAGIAVAAILVLHPFGQHPAAPPTALATASVAPAPTSPTPVITSSSPAPTPTPESERQAAGGLAALLSRSSADRNAVNDAYTDVKNCGPALNQDAQTFSKAASSRQLLLTQLADLPSRSALPQPMLQNLTSGWQASLAADRDFAAWARHQASNGCATSQSDPSFQAADGPDLRATRYKKAFLRQWNPLAAGYSLPTYQQNEF